MTLHDSLSAINKSLEDTAKDLAADIQGCANAGKYDMVTILSDTGKWLQKIKDEVAAEHVRLGCCPGSQPVSKNQFSVTITAGALKHRYFAVSAALKSGLLKPFHPITMKLPTGVQFTTVAVPPNRIRERGKIGKFYADFKVKEGDVFVVEEVSNDFWVVKKK